MSKLKYLVLMGLVIVAFFACGRRGAFEPATTLTYTLALDRAFFSSTMSNAFVNDCDGNHGGWESKDYSTVTSRIVTGNSGSSVMYQRGVQGISHSGGIVWAVGTTQFSNLKKWIDNPITITNL